MSINLCVIKIAIITLVKDIFKMNFKITRPFVLAKDGGVYFKQDVANTNKGFGFDPNNILNNSGH